MVDRSVRSLKRMMIIALVACIMGAATVIAINVHMVRSTAPFISAATTTSNTTNAESGVAGGQDDALGGGQECLIVFGALVRDTGVSLILQDRLDAAFNHWKLHPKMKIIVSGDHGRKNYDEVNAMREYLESKGVPSSLIFMDHAGFNTYETLYRARDVFKVKSAVLVTQEYHLVRAVYVGRALGMDTTGLIADARVYFKMPKYLLREYLARTKDFFNVHLVRPEPTFLGPAIPIQTSDGAATQDGK